MIDTVIETTLNTLKSLNNNRHIHAIDEIICCIVFISHLMESSLLEPLLINQCVTYLQFSIKICVDNHHQDTLDIACLLLSQLTLIGGSESDRIIKFKFTHQTIFLREQSFNSASFGYKTWNSAKVFVEYFTVHSSIIPPFFLI